MSPKEQVAQYAEIAVTAKESGLSLEEVLNLLPDQLREELDREFLGITTTARLGLDVPLFPSRALLVVVYTLLGWKPKDLFDRAMTDFKVTDDPYG